jgi:transcriptional regulator
MTVASVRDLQKGSAVMLVLALLEDRPRHGYELAKLIEVRSESQLQFQAASLYPLLYRLERQKAVEGRWVEKPNERRRRFYRITRHGRELLATQRRTWREFFVALDRVAGLDHA